MRDHRSPIDRTKLFLIRSINDDELLRNDEHNHLTRPSIQKRSTFINNLVENKLNIDSFGVMITIDFITDANILKGIFELFFNCVEEEAFC